MGCGLFVDMFICSMFNLGSFFSNFLFAGMPPQLLFFISLVIVTGIIYFYIKWLGVAGGIILAIVGIAGAFFSFGATLILTIVGLVTVFFSTKAKQIAIGYFIFGIIVLIFSTSCCL